MRLTPQILVAAYDLLTTCSPFHRWNLPNSDDIEFEVTHRKHAYGEYSDLQPKISVSAITNKTLQDVLATMAHEMCHLHLHQKGFRTWEKHGALFNRTAALICRKLGFDPASF